MRTHHTAAEYAQRPVDPCVRRELEDQAAITEPGRLRHGAVKLRKMGQHHLELDQNIAGDRPLWIRYPGKNIDNDGRRHVLCLPIGTYPIFTLRVVIM